MDTKTPFFLSLGPISFKCIIFAPISFSSCNQAIPLFISYNSTPKLLV
jgi:hypothetical protein